MRTDHDRVSVTFLPAETTVEVPRGTLLLEAAGLAGLAVDTPCGGQGRCGRCLLKIERGQVSHRENPHLTLQQLRDGWVLACTAQADGDVMVLLPARRERERVVAESAASRRAAAVRSQWPRDPCVRALYLELAPPSLDDNRSDLLRLLSTADREYGLDLELNLRSLRTLARTLRADDWRVTTVVETADKDGPARLIELRPGQHKGRVLGLAIDVGTTTVVTYLADLDSGRLVDSASAFNKQVSCGEDVISRIIFSQRGNGLEQLQRLVVETANELIGEMCARHHLDPRDIFDIVVAGNTTMTHLFLSLSPRHLREEPYVPTADRYPAVLAEHVGLAVNPEASVHCVPSVAAYVGGDIAAGVLSSGLYRSPRLELFMDVGTNGEIVLGNSEWMMADACSAGPAFEGAGVSCGMRAMRGAIEDVNINAQTLEPTVQVIGQTAPRGICGSGMIAALAEMFLTGIVTRSGRIDAEHVNAKMGARSRIREGEHGWEYVLARAGEHGSPRDISLTDVDINNLIRTKAAIYAGIAIMASRTGVDLRDLAGVLIGGAFGQHINLEQAIVVGLLPDLPWERFHYLGNTSALGAYTTLLSRSARAKADEIARSITYLELVADSSFMNEFTSALFLPHTNIDLFPSVKALLERQEAVRTAG